MASFSGSGHAHSAGQNHDIIATHHHDTPGGLPPEPVEITAVQKMISATSGSLLTGLLATPLDVVRVRWQAQGVTQQPAADFTKLALPTTLTPNGAAFRPSNLGVTACCREVFFSNNTSEACVVGPRPSTSAAITASASHTPAQSTASQIACAVEQTQQRTFTSTFDGLRKIARNEGLPTLWRGLSPTLVMAIPANIIYFTGYEWLRFNRTHSPIAKSVPDDYAPLVAGSTARMLAATAVSPIELFRTRLQAVQGGNHLAATVRGVKDMVATHGYRALWRGLTLTLWRDVPFSGMYWWGYETIRGRLTDARERARGRGMELDLKKEQLDRAGAREARARRRSRSRGHENHADTFTDSFIAGAASGGFASIVTMPFDVGKTRTQVFRDANSPTTTSSSTTSTSTLKSTAPEEGNMARLLWHIFRTEGLSGLFRGCVPRTLRVAPACAIMISSYEVGKRVFRGVNERALVEREKMEMEKGG